MMKDIYRNWKVNLGVMTLLGIGLAGCNATQQKNVTLDTEEDKVFYSVGVMFGGKLKELKLNPKEIDSLVLGLRDSISGKEPQVNVADYQIKIRDLFNERMKKFADENLKSGQTYLSEFLKEEGAKQTPSGLGYKVIEEGSGPVPKPEDTVEVHYHGTLIDGTVFDSSKERNSTVKFPLNRVIKGWTEGLQLIKEGGKIQLVIPSELAYGEHGAPPKIPGGATLKFDVELIKVIPSDEKEASAGSSKKDSKSKKK